MTPMRAVQDLSSHNEGWLYAVYMLKREQSIPSINFDALLDAVNEAAALADQIKMERASRSTHDQTNRKMKKLQKLFGNLEFELKSNGTQQALKETNVATHLAELLPSNAAEHIPNVAAGGLGEAMLFTVQKLKEPIDDWVLRNTTNTGGRPVKTARQAVLFCLLKYYEEITNQTLNTESATHLKILATHVLPPLKLSTRGVEVACARAFKEFANWAVWRRSPASAYVIGSVDIESIEDDPEGPLLPAKPRLKK